MLRYGFESTLTMTLVQARSGKDRRDGRGAFGARLASVAKEPQMTARGSVCCEGHLMTPGLGMQGQMALVAGGAGHDDYR